jgi:hypothetical protein
MKGMRTAVDVDTGEIFYAKNSKTKKKKGWCRMFQIKLEELAKDKDLRGMPLSVYLLMISKVDYDNVCRFPQILIADELGTTAQYVSKSIRLLKDKNIISEVKERGTLVKAYSFNTDYIVKGKMSDPAKDIVDCSGDVLVEAEEPLAKEATRAIKLETPKYVDFNLFWSIYPKKVGKKECQKIWGRLKVEGGKFMAISEHLRLAYIDTEKQFIPNPSTYLNGEKWNDEILTQSVTPSFDSDTPSWKRRPSTFEGSTFEGELN